MKLSREEARDLRQIAWGSFVVAHTHLTRSIDAAMTAAGVLPLDWYDVLYAVHEAPGRRIRLSALAERALVSRSGLTRLVDRIQAEGLLAREQCADDRRGAFAVLTTAGLDAMRRAWPVYRRLIDEHFGRHMTDEEAAVLYRVLRRMAPAQPVAASEPVSLTVSPTRKAAPRAAGAAHRGGPDGRPDPDSHHPQAKRSLRR